MAKKTPRQPTAPLRRAGTGNARSRPVRRAPGPTREATTSPPRGGAAGGRSLRRRVLQGRGTKPATDAAEREQLRTWACAQIDQFMRKAGIDPARNTDPDGWRWFELGSAVGFAFVGEVRGEVFFQAAAEVMPLPADRELILPLMRELLELNTNIWGSARFGIRHRRIYASVSTRVADLKAGDIGASINEVMALADAVDGELIEKYAGSSRTRK